jgi:ribosomal protein S19E (S16A)
LHAETILRNPLETYDGYARRLVIRVREIAGDAVVAVEVPQEMYGGRARRYVVPTAVLAGQLVAALKARVVKPAGFGKNRPLEDHYPPDLWGYRLTADRHRADSQGSKTRDHERAAYDIARFVQAELEAAAA